MKDFSSKFMKAAETILGLVGVLMILIETYSVFCRNVTHWSTPWVDEVLRLMFVWIVFIGAGIAFKSDELISLTLIEDGYKEKGKKVPYGIMKLIQYVAALIVSVLLIVQEWTTMIGQLGTGEATPITGYPVWIKSFGILIGFVLMAVFAVFKIIETSKNMKKAE
ncbi:MAG: TRAP transporter small permease [Clostridiales bacterium]|nr:TRAP transporter small permease [Clostridiales bacterium]